jgi:hopene-associated glycosyltransferase HpnB
LTFFLLSLLTLIIWIALFFFWGSFWCVWEFDADRDQFRALQSGSPSVVAVIPARNEAGSIKQVLHALAAQDYAGSFVVIVVDDQSDDATCVIAQSTSDKFRNAAQLQVVTAADLPSGWTGKLWALNTGVALAQKDTPDFFWFTDADVIHAPDALSRLVARAEKQNLDLTSLMILLQAQTFAERLLIPAFLFFFLMLYPPRWTVSRDAHTAGAAGGCVLLRCTALDKIGGLSAIRQEIIDDCALAGAVKSSGGKIWMGLTRASVSLRSYSNFLEIRDMIARTAFTQLRYSGLLLLGTIVGMILTFILPVVLTFSSSRQVWPFALAAWCLMTSAYLPTITFYKMRPLWAASLPIAALFFTFATCLSAVRYWRGKGGQWKGRAQAKRLRSSA